MRNQIKKHFFSVTCYISVINIILTDDICAALQLASPLSLGVSFHTYNKQTTKRDELCALALIVKLFIEKKNFNFCLSHYFPELRNPCA